MLCLLHLMVKRAHRFDPHNLLKMTTVLPPQIKRDEDVSTSEPAKLELCDNFLLFQSDDLLVLSTLIGSLDVLYLISEVILFLPATPVGQAKILYWH
jgi:hypothetical protein